MLLWLYRRTGSGISIDSQGANKLGPTADNYDSSDTDSENPEVAKVKVAAKKSNTVSARLETLVNLFFLIKIWFVVQNYWCCHWCQFHLKFDMHNLFSPLGWSKAPVQPGEDEEPGARIWKRPRYTHSRVTLGPHPQETATQTHSGETELQHKPVEYYEELHRQGTNKDSNASMSGKQKLKFTKKIYKTENFEKSWKIFDALLLCI